MPAIPQNPRYFAPTQMTGIRPSPRWAQPQIRQQGGAGQQGPYQMQGSFRPSQRGDAPGGQPRIPRMARGMPSKFLWNEVLLVYYLFYYLLFCTLA